MQKTKNHPRRKKTTSGKSRKWSGDVTKHSNALDLDKGVFTSDDPDKIATSLKRSADRSTRKKAGSYQSAMSMLNFYINRAGKNLPAGKKKTLTRAKDELKELHEEHEVSAPQKRKSVPASASAPRKRKAKRSTK